MYIPVIGVTPEAFLMWSVGKIGVPKVRLEPKHMEELHRTTVGFTAGISMCELGGAPSGLRGAWQPPDKLSDMI